MVINPKVLMWNLILCFFEFSSIFSLPKQTDEREIRPSAGLQFSWFSTFLAL